MLAILAAPPAASARWCRSGEPPVEVSRRTSCAFADRIVTRVHIQPLLRRGQRRTIHVRSPVTHRRHRIRLIRRGDRVTGTGRRGLWVRFAYVGARWCRYGDPPIRASSRTPCTFAGRILNRVYNGPPLRNGQRRTIHVRSPVTHRRYRIRLIRRGNYITGSDRQEIWVHFLYQG